MMNMEKIVAPTESPIILEKLLTNYPTADGKEPNLLASPNAFDWDKRLALPGGSPNAFALSLSGSEMPTTNQLFDYPAHPPPAQQNPADFIMNEATGGGQDYHLFNDSTGYSDSPVSINGISRNDMINPLPPKGNIHNRKDSHRESERRRRESFKNSMFHLENLVVLTLNRAGSCKIIGKGPKRKLAHAEIYQMARDIIVTLKEEIVKVEQMNQELALALQN